MEDERGWYITDFDGAIVEAHGYHVKERDEHPASPIITGIDAYIQRQENGSWYWRVYGRTGLGGFEPSAETARQAVMDTIKRLKMGE